MVTFHGITGSTFNDATISKIYLQVEQFHHYALHMYPVFYIDEHVIKGRVVVLRASFFQDHDYWVLLRVQNQHRQELF